MPKFISRNHLTSKLLSNSKSSLILLNTSYLTDSYIGFTLKMFALTGELGQVHTAKKNISNFPPCEKLVIFD